MYLIVSSSGEFWINLTKNPEGDWVWPNGAATDLPWGFFQPGLFDTCVSVYKSGETYQLGDKSCDKNQNYICKF